MCADSTGGFGGFSWDTLSSISNVLGVLILGPSILVLQWLFKKQSAHRAQKKVNQQKAIMDIAKEVNAPLQKEVENIGNLLGKYTEQNETIITNLDTITDALNEFRNNQIQIKTKVDYLDKVFQNNMHFGGRSHVDDSNDNDDEDDTPMRSVRKKTNRFK